MRYALLAARSDQVVAECWLVPFFLSAGHLE
jgi:hypothetical protein